MPEPGGTIGKRIAEIRGRETEDDFSSRHNMHKNTLRRYESDERPPSAEFLVSLTHSGVNAHWILTGEGPKWLLPEMIAPQEEMLRDTLKGDPKAIEAREQRLLEYGANLARQTSADVGLVMVPHLGIEAGAGPGRYAVVSDRAGELAYRRDLLLADGINPRYAGLVTIRGDSMKEKLHDGDLALVDRSDRDVRSGLCYVLRQGDEIIVKYLHKMPDGRVQATSENSASFPPFFLEVGVHIEIIGRLRSHTHTWK